VVLNQILDSDPSQIFGRIDAVGTVFLINPRGIVFGETAQINVGGLLASTLDIDADDFLAQEDGAYLWDSFAMTPEAPGRIENLGQITAGAGGVTMVGASIDNSGLVQAQLGSINLYG